MTRTTYITITALLTIAPIAGSSRAGVTQADAGVDTTIFARAIQPGEVVRLDLTCACDVERATATVFGRALALGPMSTSGAWRGLIGIDVEVRPGRYPIAIVVERTGQPAVKVTRQLAVTAKRFPTRRINVADRFVNPDPDTVTRIQQEARRLDALFQTATPALGSMPFQAPVTERPSGSFGARSVLNGQPRSMHGGVDFGSREGTPIAAPGRGTVVLAEELYFTGNTVMIDHGAALYSVLAHLSRMAVAAGSSVERGTIVGDVGATGRVTGPHLHWGMRLNGARIDPLSLIAAVSE